MKISSLGYGQVRKTNKKQNSPTFNGTIYALVNDHKNVPHLTAMAANIIAQVGEMYSGQFGRSSAKEKNYQLFVTFDQKYDALAKGLVTRWNKVFEENKQPVKLSLEA